MFKHFLIPFSTDFIQVASGTVRPLRARKNGRRRGFWKGHAAHITRKKDSKKKESKVVMQTGERLARWMPRTLTACKQQLDLEPRQRLRCDGGNYGNNNDNVTS